MKIRYKQNRNNDNNIFNYLSDTNKIQNYEVKYTEIKR